MDETRNGVVKCSHCDKEIPKSAAMTSEGTDYTWYFCGKACYEKWDEKKNSNE